MKVYRKWFYSDKFGKEIEYFHSWKRGRWGKSAPALGREDGDQFKYTQKLVFLLDLIVWFAVLFFSACIGRLFQIIGTSLDTAGYITIGIMIPLLVIYYIWGQPRWIHVKEIRNYLDNNL